MEIAMREKNLMSWLSYLQSQKADTPYLALFKELVALAYKLLGGGDVDVGIDSARETHDSWRADKYESAAVSSGRPRTPDRIGVSSRREFIRYGHVKRKLYEDAAANVFRMFYGVLGYQPFDRREPWERDGEAAPAEDAAKLEQLRAHAQTLRVFLPAPNIEQRELPLDDVREGVAHELKSRRDSVRIRELEQQVSNLIFDNTKLQQQLDPEGAAKAVSEWQPTSETGPGPSHDQVQDFVLHLVESDEPLTSMPPRESTAILEMRSWYKKAISQGRDKELARGVVMEMLRDLCRFGAVQEAAAAAKR
jgi:hypothetical protein